MADRGKVIKGMTELKKYLPSTMWEPINNAIALLKEQEHKDKMFHALEDDWKRLKERLKDQESLLGIQQTADSITFISTGTAQQGEERGIVFGQARMHDWLEKELLYRGLLTDAIRAVFHDAKRLVK